MGLAGASFLLESGAQVLEVKTGLVSIDLTGVRARENPAASSFKAKEAVRSQCTKNLEFVVWSVYLRSAIF